MKDPIFFCFCEHSLVRDWSTLSKFDFSYNLPTPHSTWGLLIAYTVDLGSNIRESQSSVKICTNEGAAKQRFFLLLSVLVKTTEQDGS